MHHVSSAQRKAYLGTSTIPDWDKLALALSHLPDLLSDCASCVSAVLIHGNIKCSACKL